MLALGGQTTHATLRLSVRIASAMFSTFDRILDKYGIRKVEVLGDAFFVVGGCPVQCDDHAERCANAAIEMLLHMPILRRFAGADINMRIGLHTGPVVAGVVGLRDPRYHLFGATPPYANAMESHGVPGRIHCSAETFAKLRDRQIERANAFVDHRRVVETGLPRAGVAAAIIRGRGIQTLEASSSQGRYPSVSLELLDEFTRWKKAAGSANLAPLQATRAGESAAATSRTAAGDQISHSSTPGTTPKGSRPSHPAPVAASHIVPETGEGSIRSQVQLWQGSTFMGWEIRGCMVQNGLLYADLPDVAEAVSEALSGPTANAVRPAPTAATPVPQGGGVFALQSKKLPQPPAASAHAAVGGGDKAAASAVDADDINLDIYVPADPGSKFFGPGAGFFAFEARPNIEIKGRGVQTTYFLSRAEPPFVPELAQSLAKLQRDLEEWQALHGKGPGPQPRRSASEPMSASSGPPPRLGQQHQLRVPPPVVTARVSEMETERQLHLKSARSNGQMSLGGSSVQSSPASLSGAPRRAEMKTPPLLMPSISLQRPPHIAMDVQDGGGRTPASSSSAAGYGRGRASIHGQASRASGLSAAVADAGLRGFDDPVCDNAECFPSDWNGGGASVARSILRAPPASSGGGSRAAGGAASGGGGGGDSRAYSGPTVPVAGAVGPSIVGTTPTPGSGRGGGGRRDTAAAPLQPLTLVPVPGQRGGAHQLVTTARADDFSASSVPAADPPAPVTRAPSSPPGVLSIQSFRV